MSSSPPSPSFSSSSPLLDSSSSSTGPSNADVSPDATSYPTIFLLAIFLPSVFVGLVILYLHYSMRRYGEIRWIGRRNIGGGLKGQGMWSDGGVEGEARSPVNLVTALKEEMGGEGRGAEGGQRGISGEEEVKKYGGQHDGDKRLNESLQEPLLF